MEREHTVRKEQETSRCEQKPRTARSNELLFVGNGAGIHDKLLLNPKHSRQSGVLQTVKIARSDILDRVQSFLPHIAHANEELRRQMETTPATQFDIENLADNLDRFVEMDVSLVELSGSDDSCSEESSSEEDCLQDDDDDVIGEVTTGNFRLPKAHGVKGKIEVLESRKE